MGLGMSLMARSLLILILAVAMQLMGSLRSYMPARTRIPVVL